MGLFDWFRRRNSAAPARAVREWHAAWEAALAALDSDAPARLAAWLDADPALSEDREIEDEMLEALRDALTLERDLAAQTLPSIPTTHRAAAGEPCHFSAPVSMPDDPAQPTGRLLLTSGRAAFAGGTRSPSIPWHAAREVVRAGRDLIVVRAGGTDGIRFRCNTYSDAVRAAALARHLSRAARRPPT
jgi:hypothetical protein